MVHNQGHSKFNQSGFGFDNQNMTMQNFGSTVSNDFDYKQWFEQSAHEFKTIPKPEDKMRL